jgi:ankyrin repeat protein
MNAARDGDVATIKRLHDKGVDITERSEHGFTAIMLAAGNGNAATVKFLQAAGANLTAKDDSGFSALHFAALFGKLAIVQYILQEVAASISDANNDGDTIWELLALQDADPIALASLLKIRVMLDDAPPAFVAKLSPAHAEIATRGQQYHAQLPSYLQQQRAMVVAHCPLPAVLQPLVEAYAALTPDDMWADGLGVQQVDRPKRPRLLAGADPDVEVQLWRSLRLRQKRA